MSGSERTSEVMTVARVFEPTEDGVEVVFLESARFYRLPANAPDFESKLGVLKEAAESGFRVEVVRESKTSDVIEDVKPA